MVTTQNFKDLELFAVQRQKLFSLSNFVLIKTGVLKIIPQGAVFAAPHACLELHLVLYVHPESVLPSDTAFF